MARPLPGGKDNMWNVLNPTFRESNSFTNFAANATPLPPRDLPSPAQSERSRGSVTLPPLNRNYIASQSQPIISEERIDDEPYQEYAPSPSKEPMRLPLISKPETAVLEISGKVRELEINLLDLKASFERRLSQLLEEVPNRMSREFKLIEGRDAALWKENNSKLIGYSDEIILLKESMKAYMTTANSKLADFQKGIDSNAFKVASLEKRIEQVQITGGTGHAGGTGGGGGSLEVDAEVRFLRDQLQDERLKRESAAEDQ